MVERAVKEIKLRSMIALNLEGLYGHKKNFLALLFYILF
jgi:hypothetical protein